MLVFGGVIFFSQNQLLETSMKIQRLQVDGALNLIGMLILQMF